MSAVQKKPQSVAEEAEVVNGDSEDSVDGVALRPCEMRFMRWQFLMRLMTGSTAKWRRISRLMAGVMRRFWSEVKTVSLRESGVLWP